MKSRTVREWQKNYAKGMYDKAEFDTMVDAGWYDAFVSVASLKSRLDKMAKIILQIKDGGKVDLDNHYIWFKNNLTGAGLRYDDFRISTFAGNNQFVVDMKSEYTKQFYGVNYVVFSWDNGYKEPIFKCNDVKNLVKWFNTPYEEQED